MILNRYRKFGKNRKNACCDDILCWIKKCKYEIKETLNSNQLVFNIHVSEISNDNLIVEICKLLCKSKALKDLEHLISKCSSNATLILREAFFDLAAYEIILRSKHLQKKSFQAFFWYQVHWQCHFWHQIELMSHYCWSKGGMTQQTSIISTISIICMISKKYLWETSF